MSSLKKAREILRLTTREAAEFAGISHEAVAVAEREGRCTPKTAQKLEVGYREAAKAQIAAISKFVL